MADKRFLGLGFTFAATDKGLEKKLQKYHDLITGISKGLNDIAKGAQKASGGVSRMKAPRAAASSASGTAQRSSRSYYRPRVAPVKRQTGFEKRHVGFEDLKMQSEFESLGGQVGKLFKDVTGQFKLTGTEAAHFVQMLDDMKFDVTGAGKGVKFTEKQLQKLTKMTSDYAEGVVKARKETGMLKHIFAGIKDWIKEIGSAADNFLQSLGLDLKKMIPPQISAAGKLVGAVLSPLKKAPGKLQEKLMKKQIAQAGFRPPSKTQAKMLEKLISNTDPKDKSIFDKMKDLFKKMLAAPKALAALLGGAIMKMATSPVKTFAKGVDMAWNGFKKLLGVIPAIYNWFKKLDIVEAVSGFFEGIAEAASGLWEGLVEFGQALLEPLAEVAVFGVAIAGFAKGVWDNLGFLKDGVVKLWGGISKTFEGIVNVAEALWGRLKLLTQMFMDSHPVIKGVFDSISHFGDLLVSIGKMIFDGWRLIGELLTKVLGGTLGKIGEKLFNFGSSLNDLAKNVKQGTQDMQKPDTGPTPPSPDQFMRDQNLLQSTATPPAPAMDQSKLEDIHGGITTTNQTLLGLRQDIRSLANRPIESKIVGDVGKFLKASDNAARKQLGGSGKTL